ncbi:hypothetical protein 000TH008_47 [Bacillus phage 000TH008]|nr:hypothetical protein 000TH008_47 [Bacillus phage 000TH008]QQO40741.1 hypothetical protein 000TH009_47 [Bacillus phage 000TH009]
MRPPTEKQVKLIKNMEMLTDKIFTGATIQEASQFISDNMELYQEKKELAFDMVYYEDAY